MRRRAWRNLPGRSRRLLLISIASLYFEMLHIRWLPT